MPDARLLILKPKTGTTWAEGFYPDKIRITYDAQNSDGYVQLIYVVDTQDKSQLLGSSILENGLSGVPFLLDWGGDLNADIAAIEFEIEGFPNAGYWRILNIEFGTTQVEFTPTEPEEPIPEG